MKTTLSSLKERLVGREEEMAKMEKMNGSLQKELEESKEMLRTNENGELERERERERWRESWFVPSSDQLAQQTNE